MRFSRLHGSVLAGAFFLASSRAHLRIPAILSGTVMVVLALSGCTAAGSSSVPEPAPTPTPSPSSNSRISFCTRVQTLMTAWPGSPLPGTNIDGPVQQGPDNDYYLRRDSDGNEDYRGCYFADSDAIVSLANLSRNVVIYGHTFTDGWEGGFEQLDKYLDTSWAQNHKALQLEINGTVLEYEVCSVGFCDVEETSLPIYCNLEDEAFRYLIEDANARNQVDGLEQLSAGDQILTLATCTEKETERLVIVAKQIYDTMIATEEDAHS